MVKRSKDSVFPAKGGKPTGIFSTHGKQKNDPVGKNYMPNVTADKFDKKRQGPVKRDNMQKRS